MKTTETEALEVAEGAVGVAVEDIQILAMATAAPLAIQTEIEVATAAEAVVGVLLSAAKKTLSSWED